MATRPAVIKVESVNDWRSGWNASLDQFPIACMDLDSDGVIRRANGLFFQLLGHQQCSVLGKPVWNLIVPEEVERARRGYAQKLTGERYLLPFERHYLHASGRVLTVQVYDMIVLDMTEGVVGIRSCVVDVSERSCEEAGFKSYAVFSEALLRAIPAAIIVTDVLGSITAMNPAAERLTEIQQRDAVGHTLEELFDFGHSELGGSLLASLPAGGLAAAALETGSRGLTIRCPIKNALTNLTLSCIADSSDLVVGVVATIR